LGTTYLEAFIELEDVLRRIMQRTGEDRHARAERGWTPPPKGYTDDFSQTDID
jgi:hypothetical protein